MVKGDETHAPKIGEARFRRARARAEGQDTLSSHSHLMEIGLEVDRC
jgi:hypothetical protein